METSTLHTFLHLMTDPEIQRLEHALKEQQTLYKAYHAYMNLPPNTLGPDDKVQCEVKQKAPTFYVQKSRLLDEVITIIEASHPNIQNEKIMIEVFRLRGMEREALKLVKKGLKQETIGEVWLLQQERELTRDIFKKSERNRFKVVESKLVIQENISDQEKAKKYLDLLYYHQYNTSKYKKIATSYKDLPITPTENTKLLHLHIRTHIQRVLNNPDEKLSDDMKSFLNKTNITNENIHAVLRLMFEHWQPSMDDEMKKTYKTCMHYIKQDFDKKVIKIHNNIFKLFATLDVLLEQGNKNIPEIYKKPEFYIPFKIETSEDMKIVFHIVKHLQRETNQQDEKWKAFRKHIAQLSFSQEVKNTSEYEAWKLIKLLNNSDEQEMHSTLIYFRKHSYESKQFELAKLLRLFLLSSNTRENEKIKNEITSFLQTPEIKTFLSQVQWQDIREDIGLEGEE